MKKIFAAFLMISGSAVDADLTVYTYDSFVSEWGPGPALEKEFESQCKCDIEFIAAEDGVAILNRIRIEGDRTKADIILGLDNGLIEETRASGLVQKNAITTPIFREELNWNDDTFVPYDYGYFAFVYNTDKIEKPATSFKELLASDASIIYQDPRTSTPGQGLMHWINAAYGDKSEQAWKSLADQTVTVTKGWWEAYSMFLEGDADYVLSYSTSPAYHKVVEEKSNIEAAEFSEGHVAQIEVAAISSFTDSPELANQFLNFLVSETAQSIIPTTNWMEPVIEGVELPKAFSENIQPKRIGFSDEEFSKNRKTWIRNWLGAVTE